MGCREIFQKNIKFYTQKKNLTMKSLSRMIDVPYTTVTSYFHGNSFPRAEILDAISEALEIHCTALLAEQEEVELYEIVDKEMLQFVDLLHKKPELKNLLSDDLTEEHIDLIVALAKNLTKQNVNIIIK